MPGNWKSVKDIFGQIINLQGEKKYQENLRKTDLHIKVDVSGYSAASFTKEAIDTLIVRGEQSAMADWDKLLTLKKKMGLREDYQPVARDLFLFLTRKRARLFPLIHR